MSNMSELHQLLTDEGLDCYEGIPFAEVRKLQRDNKITVIEAGLISLTCPEWHKLKEGAKDGFNSTH